MFENFGFKKTAIAVASFVGELGQFAFPGFTVGVCYLMAVAPSTFGVAIITVDMLVTLGLGMLIAGVVITVINRVIRGRLEAAIMQASAALNEEATFDDAEEALAAMAEAVTETKARTAKAKMSKAFKKDVTDVEPKEGLNPA